VVTIGTVLAMAAHFNFRQVQLPRLRDLSPVDHRAELDVTAIEERIFGDAIAANMILTARPLWAALVRSSAQRSLSAAKDGPVS
jgi:hypothetical protein